MNWHNLCSPQPRASKLGRHSPGDPRSGQGEDMCGRYASARKRIELLEEFRVERDRVSEPLEPDYNVAPTKRVYAVMTRDQRPSESSSESSSASSDEAPGGANGRSGRESPSGVARELRVVRWGLVPFWAKDPKIGSRMINARAETVSSKPAFRHAFKRRRCLLPADGYYEWQRPDGTEADTPGKGPKQPYFICRGDGGPLAFAGLYELWRDAALPDDHERAWLWTATIITTSASDELGKIHDRMPMVIEPDRWADWLDPAADDPADLAALLAPAAAGGLISYPVSMTVNSVRNNGPDLITRLEPAPPGPDPGSGAPSARSGRSRSAASRGTPGSVADKLL
jgi:putative SOS response-associated peptidase YedK